MKKPTVHLICNAHLDPVWQWRWEEGCSEAVSTFATATECIRRHPALIFNHNEALLYRWVMEYDRALFREIQKLVKKGRWCISGGWFLQPDVNLPSTESVIRQISEGRRFFRKYFGAEPKTAYNFDSFGHSGGLPQILVRGGYKMYIHMRPQESELSLPSDLYRWRGVDGSEILTYRITIGLYHTERDNIRERLEEATAFALRMGRDVPLFWGIGDHGGGPAMEDLEIIDKYISEEKNVRIIHSTTENLFASLKAYRGQAPLVEGDLQRIFTGCYSSLSRIKRRAAQCSSAIVQSEALRTATWWFSGQTYPAAEFDQCWRDAIFNDFHDVLTGSFIEPAEKDALDLYGKVMDKVRHLRLGAAFAFNKGKKRKTYIPLTLLNANPSFRKVPIETECMLDLRPKWSGEWHLRLFTLDGVEIPCQEVRPEALLPFNQWRRKICFIDELPPVGAKKYRIEIFEGRREDVRMADQALGHSFDYKAGLINHIAPGNGQNLLTGHLFKPLVIEDGADSWGTGRYSYRDISGIFEPVEGSCREIESGPVRTKTESVFSFRKSSIVLHTISYNNWPFLEFRFRISWNEKGKMLKLSVPTRFSEGTLLCQIPGGAIRRPADGQEHVQGRWLLLEGIADGKPAAIGLVNSGQHGIDFYKGELRLTVLRSAPYCHEQGLKLGEDPSVKYMDQGVHEFRLLVTAGKAENIRHTLAGAAEWLSAPPAAYPHLPLGVKDENESESILSLSPDNIHMTAFKQSWDGKALILRLHETVGIKTKASINTISRKKPLSLIFKPFEIKTLRIGKRGNCSQVDMINEI